MNVRTVKETKKYRHPFYNSLVLNNHWYIYFGIVPVRCLHVLKYMTSRTLQNYCRSLYMLQDQVSPSERQSLLLHLIQHTKETIDLRPSLHESFGCGFVHINYNNIKNTQNDIS